MALHCHEASQGTAHQDSKDVVDEPSFETSEKESEIDLNNKITLLSQTSKPDPVLCHFVHLNLIRYFGKMRDQF